MGSLVLAKVCTINNAPVFHFIFCYLSPVQDSYHKRLVKTLLVCLIIMSCANTESDRSQTVFVLISMILEYSSLNKTPLSQNLRILHKTSQEVILEVSTFRKVCSFMCSLLCRGSFWMDYRISTKSHGGYQPVTVLRCYGSLGVLDSSLQLIYSVGSGVSYLPLNNNPETSW